MSARRALAALVVAAAAACGDDAGPVPGSGGDAAGAEGAAVTRAAAAAQASAGQDPSVVPGVPRPADDGFLSEPFTATAREVVPLAELAARLDGLPARLDDGAAGLELRLPAGRLTASLALEGPLRLAADGSRPTLAGDDGPAITVTGGRVELVGLVLQAGATGPAVLVEQGTLVLSGCVVLSDDGDGAVLASPDARVEVRDGLFTTGAGTALRVPAGATARLLNPEFVACLTGLALDGGEASVRGGRWGHGERGVHVTGGGRLAMEGATLLSNRAVAVDVDASHADLTGVEIRAPGGVAALRYGAGATGRVEGCELVGTPAEADHHAGEITREHLEAEIMVGIDHHVLDSLLEVQDGADPRVLDCRIRGALGHGLHVQAAAGRFERVTISGAVFFGVLLEDVATPRLSDVTIRDCGENGLFAWREAAGEVRDSLLEGNGRYSGEAGGWAQVVLTEGTTTRLVGCDLRAGGGAGVAVSGAGTQAGLTDCRITDHDGPGLEVSAGALCVVTDSTVHANSGAGLRVFGEGLAWIADSALTDNGAEGVRVETSAEARVEGCEVRGNSRRGVVFDGGARGKLAGCQVVENRGGDVVVAESAVVEREGG